MLATVLLCCHVQRLGERDFKHILSQRTATAAAYAGQPLAGRSTKVRGSVLQTLARRCDEERHPRAAFADADLGTCVDGSRRSHNTAEYDWLRDGRRVECKSAQLVWDTSNRRWMLLFHKVKLPHEGTAAAFDELQLVMYTPRGVYIYRHDQQLGVSTHGKATGATGHQIKIYGPCGEECWRAALEVILAKLEILAKLDAGGCQRLDFAPMHDPRLAAACDAHPPTGTEAAFQGVPLADMSGKARGDCLEQMAREADAMRHPLAVVADADLGTCVDGSKRSHNRAEYDWQRDGLRVECKGSQLAWNRSKRRWELLFTNVKLPHEGTAAAFDELQLAVYTPWGVYIYRHDRKLGVSTHGKATEATGHAITFCGPRGEECWKAALEVILAKLDASGCERLAEIKFA